MKCLTVSQEHIYAHKYTYILISTHIYTYIQTHTYTYAYIHYNWQSDSARIKCGTVPQKEFAYLYRRLKCLTVPQEDKVPQVPQFIF